MKNWPIHLGWAVVTIVVAGVWGRFAARPPEAEPARPSAPEPASTAPPAALSVEAPKTAAAAAQPSAPGTSLPSEEEVRRLLAHSQTWLQGWRALGPLDPATRIKLMKEMALHSTDPSIRHNGIQGLANLVGREAAPLLLQMLENRQDDSSARSLAARILGDLGAAEATNALLRAFREQDEAISLESANALQKLGVPGPAREVLDGCARTYESPDSALRRKAVETAGQIRHESALPFLARALRDSSGDVRIAAIESIAYGLRSTDAALLEPLTRDPNPDVAEEARQAVEGMKEDR